MNGLTAALELLALGLIAFGAIKASKHHARVLETRSKWTTWMWLRAIAAISALAIAQLLGKMLAFSILAAIFAFAFYKDVNSRIKRSPGR